MCLFVLNVMSSHVITQNNFRIMEHQWKTQCNVYNFAFHFTFMSLIIWRYIPKVCTFTLWKNSLPFPTFHSPQQTEFYRLDLPGSFVLWLLRCIWTLWGPGSGSKGGEWDRTLTPPGPCLRGVHNFIEGLSSFGWFSPGITAISIIALFLAFSA